MSDSVPVRQTHVISFDQELRPWILKTFGLYVGNNECLYHEKDGTEALGLDGQFVLVKDFAGVVKTVDGLRVVRAGILGTLDLLDLLEAPSVIPS
jgi:hypothetical protein